MDEKLVKIRLYGDLGEKIGKTWDLAISSVSEAVHAIEILSGRSLYSYLHKQSKTGVGYKVLINEKLVTYSEKPDNIETLSKSELCIQKNNLETIDIVPVIEGAGDILEIFTIIVGVALIATGVFAGAGGTLFGLSAAATASLKTGLVIAGIGLVAAGVSSMLTKPPSFDPFQAFENGGGRPSYLFSGPQNTIREGGPVPVVYGEAIVGSQTIAANYKVEFEASEAGNTLSNLDGDIDSDFDVVTQELTVGTKPRGPSGKNPIIAFDFHPEDDEIILPYIKTRQDSGTATLFTTEIHIIKYRDIKVKSEARSATADTYFYPDGEPFGFRSGMGLFAFSTPTLTKNKYYTYPILAINEVISGGNVSASVNSIKTDRVNNRVFVGGAFKAFYTDVTLVKKKDGDYTKAVNLLCIEADGKINNANDHAADIFTHPQPNNIVWSIDVQDDGKVLIGGEFTEIDGVSQSNFARLNTNGSLESFNPNPSKIIHAITTGTVDGTEYMFIAGEDGYLVKYSTAATPVADTTFNSAVAALGWEVGDTIWSVELFNGWLVIGGEFEFTQDSVTYTNLIRVNKDTGALDTNFNFTFTASDQDQIHMLPVNEQMGSGSTPITRDGLPRSTDNPSVRTIAGNADGDRLIIGGLFKDANSETSITTKNIFAVLEDGTIDKKFNPKPVLNDSGPDGHIQLAKYRKDLPSSDGNLYIAGSFTHFNSKAYTPEEVEALELRTLFTPTDRSLTNVARLFG